MRLYLMHLGRMGTTQEPIPGYLIQTEEGENILIDTGFPRIGIGAYRKHAYAPVAMDEEDYVVNRLAEIGIAPSDIHVVISTHFDVDHAGNFDVFPNATFVVQRQHYLLAKQGSLDRLNWARSSWDAPGLRYEFVDGDTTWAKDITLIETSGHVPWHQSVLLQLPKTGPVLLAIDAIPKAQHLSVPPEQRPVSLFDHDAAGARRSTRKLVDMMKRENISLVIHGHDSDQWPTLRQIPAFYE